jgi:RNase P subunit RPR2
MQSPASTEISNEQGYSTAEPQRPNPVLDNRQCDLARINAMSDLQSSPPELPPYAQRPRCPRCQARMTVQHTIASRPGFEQWTLRCTNCGHIHEAQVHIDPMKSDAQGWLHGELGQPK